MYDVPLSPRTALISVDRIRALTGSHVALRYSSDPNSPRPTATNTARNAPTQPQLVATGWPLMLPETGAAASALTFTSPSALVQPQNVRTVEAHAASVPSSVVLYGVQGMRPPELVRNTIRKNGLDWRGPPAERSSATSFRSASGYSSVVRCARRCTTMRTLPAPRSIS